MDTSKCEIEKFNLSVEVLKIGNKQATQSFINQVELEGIEQYYGSLNEMNEEVEIIGYINYYPKSDNMILLHRYWHILYIDCGIRRGYFPKRNPETFALKQIFIAC